MTSAVGTERRERYLASHLDDLERFVRSAGGKRPPAVQIGERALPVEAWEWDALVEWCGSSPAGWQSLLAKGLALEARSVKAFESEHDASELQFDAILGFKLMTSLQKSVEKMVLQGRMDQAKKLTLFRHRINDNITRVGERIGEAALREAEVLGKASGENSEAAVQVQVQDRTRKIDPGVQALLELEEKLEKIAAQPGPQALTPRPREEGAPEEATPGAVPSPRSRMWILGAVLGTLVLLWVVMVAWPAARKQTLHTFTRADFAAIDAIQNVVARPPSLFVQVDASKWRLLSEDERRNAVLAVAAAIEPAGYSGARFGAANGTTLAQWLKQTGVSLQDLAKSPS